MKGDRFGRMQEQKWLVRQAAAEGRVADNLEYRKALMQRVHNGEITLEQAQAQLKQVKRNARSNGQVTRGQAYKGY